MTAHELILLLTNLPPDTEMKVASQPQYPLRENIVSVSTFSHEPGIAWIATEQDSKNPYALSEAWQ